MPVPPPAPLISTLLSALKRMEPNSEAFLPTLELFLQSGEERKLLEQLEGSAAVHAADVLEKLVDVLAFSDIPEYRKRILRLLRSLCGLWGILPTSYEFRGEVELLDDHPFAPASRNVEVFRGVSGDERVAVKALKTYMLEDPSRLKKRLSQEAIIWKNLRHPNVLPLYGVCFLRKQPCLISPWMKNGNIRDFVAKSNVPPSDRFKLLVDVCSGLQYLHTQDIVHGDLKGDNVLIDNNRRARLADFGLANFDRSRWLVVTSGSTSPGGTNAYMAPELFRRGSKEAQPGPLMRKEADIYALGMLIYEVLTGERPFGKMPNHWIMLRVPYGERPQRPSSTEQISDRIWEMLQECWSDDPTQRPTLEYIINMCMIHAGENAVAMHKFLASRHSSPTSLRLFTTTLTSQGSKNEVSASTLRHSIPHYLGAEEDRIPGGDEDKSKGFGD